MVTLLQIVVIANYLNIAPEEKKIMAEGKCSYEFERLWKDFGVQYKSTDHEDRIALCSVIAECFRLEIYEKSIYYENFNFEFPNGCFLLELELTDYPAFFKNTINRCPIDYGCFERIYLGRPR